MKKWLLFPLVSSISFIPFSAACNGETTNKTKIVDENKKKNYADNNSDKNDLENTKNQEENTKETSSSNQSSEADQKVEKNKEEDTSNKDTTDINEDKNKNKSDNISDSESNRAQLSDSTSLTNSKESSNKNNLETSYNENKVTNPDKTQENKEQENQDDKYSKSVNWKLGQNSLYYDFFKDIVISAKNPYPSIFLNRNASQVYIWGMISMLAQLELSKDDQVNAYNDIMYFIDHNIWRYENKDNPHDRFNFNYILNKYPDILKNNQVNINEGKVAILENTKYINGQNQGYLVFPRSLKELEAYLRPYLDAGVKLFDFFIPDLSFIYFDETMRNWIIKHANKITLLSDGNAQPYSFIRDDYMKWLSKNKLVYSKPEVLKIWNDFKKTTSLYLELDYHYFYTLEDKFKIFNLNSNYIKEFNDELDKKGLSWAKLNIKTYPLNSSTIYDYIELNNSNISNDYLTLNNLNDRTFLDFITNGQENYDPNKKNLVFMGSSLFRKRDNGEWRFNTQQYALDEIHKYFEKVFELYPTEEYNYFFKLHPVYSSSESIEYINFLLGDKSNKAIILNPSIAWENMLVVDYNQIANNKSVLFDQNRESKTKLYGLQATTTTILATMTFLKEAFNWDNEKIKTFVDIRDFPLSNSFNIVKRDIQYQNPEEGYKENITQMINVYKYFIYSKDFPSQQNWIDMRTFLERNN